jgi:hypothetical protein
VAPCAIHLRKQKSGSKSNSVRRANKTSPVEHLLAAQARGEGFRRCLIRYRHRGLKIGDFCLTAKNAENAKEKKEKTLCPLRLIPLQNAQNMGEDTAVSPPSTINAPHSEPPFSNQRTPEIMPIYPFIPVTTNMQ